MHEILCIKWDSITLGHIFCVINSLIHRYIIQITKTSTTVIRNEILFARKACPKYSLFSLPYNTITIYKILLGSETFDKVLIGMKIKKSLS